MLVLESCVRHRYLYVLGTILGGVDRCSTFIEVTGTATLLVLSMVVVVSTIRWCCARPRRLIALGFVIFLGGRFLEVTTGLHFIVGTVGAFVTWLGGLLSLWENEARERERQQRVRERRLNAAMRDRERPDERSHSNSPEEAQPNQDDYPDLENDILYHSQYVAQSDCLSSGDELRVPLMADQSIRGEAQGADK